MATPGTLIGPCGPVVDTRQRLSVSELASCMECNSVSYAYAVPYSTDTSHTIQGLDMYQVCAILVIVIAIIADTVVRLIRSSKHLYSPYGYVQSTLSRLGCRY